MLAYKFDTQLLIEGEDLSEDAVTEYITENIEGDCLLAVGDEELIKIHFHTNTPYSASVTGSHHSFEVFSPGASKAMWLNQESFFAPCQCFTPAGM